MPVIVGSLIAVAIIAVLCALKHKKMPVQEMDSGIYMRLEVLNGDAVTRSMERNLTRELWVGRDQACDIAFDSAALSRRHARIFTTDGRVYIEDSSSQNGTQGNGNRVEMPVALRSGDEITVADVRF